MISGASFPPILVRMKFVQVLHNLESLFISAEMAVPFFKTEGIHWSSGCFNKGKPY